MARLRSESRTLKTLSKATEMFFRTDDILLPGQGGDILAMDVLSAFTGLMGQTDQATRGGFLLEMLVGLAERIAARWGSRGRDRGRDREKDRERERYREREGERERDRKREMGGRFDTFL